MGDEPAAVILLIGVIFLISPEGMIKRSSFAYAAATALEYGCQSLFLWESQ